jgi:hypothetical protein
MSWKERWAIGFSALVVGCGSTSDGGPASGSGLPRTITVVSLTADQGAQLCDWINGAEGGYDRTVDCGSAGPLATDKNQAACVGGLPDLQLACPSLTVGQVEDCAAAEGMDLCKFDTEPACAPLRLCACDPG